MEERTRALFSKVFDTRLADKIKFYDISRGASGQSNFRVTLGEAAGDRLMAVDWIKSDLKNWFTKVAPTQISNLCNGLIKFAEEFIAAEPSDARQVQKNAAEMDVLEDQLRERRALAHMRLQRGYYAEPEETAILQSDETPLKSREMKADRLPALIDRLRKVTKGHGKKSALARTLGVPPQRVREWLAEEVAPGGETTLRLLEWVTAEEAKQNTLAGASNTHKGEQTRQRKSNHENLKSSPPKRGRYSKSK
jgi:DNA-binding transcriptional regulator YiaG